MVHFSVNRWYTFQLINTTVRQFFNQALQYAELTENDKMKAVLYNNKAISFGFNQFNDSCLIYLQKAEKIYYDIDSTSEKCAMIYNNLAVLFRQMKYYEFAFRYMLKSLRIVEHKGNDTLLALRLNNMAAFQFDIKNYEKARFYATKAYSYFQKFPDSEYKVNSLIALSAINESLNMIDTALFYAKEALDFPDKFKNKTNISDLYNTLGTIYLKKENYNLSKEFFLKALYIKDSLNHNKYNQYLGLTNVYRNENKIDSATYFLNLLIKEAEIDSLSENISNAYKEGYELYKRFNKTDITLKYLTLYKEWSDIHAKETNRVKIEELNLKYETEKKELQNKQLRFENLQKEDRIKTLTLTSVSSVLAAILIIVFIFMIYNHKKRRLSLKISEEENYRVYEVFHDHGNDLLSISKNKLHLLDELTREKITSVGNDLRDYSHYKFKRDFKKLPFKASLDVIKVHSKELYSCTAEFNDEHIKKLDKLNNDIKTVIYRILMELVRNGGKHSGVDNLQIDMEMNNRSVSIKYHDKGKGADLSTVKQGSGISSIERLINAVKGTYKIETSPGKGFKFGIVIPLKKYIIF